MYFCVSHIFCPTYVYNYVHVGMANLFFSAVQKVIFQLKVFLS